MRPRLICVVVLILAFAFAAGLTPATAQVPILATITGPNAAAPSEAVGYDLAIVGGPVEPVNYTVQWYVTGPDASGALPAASSPTTLTSNQTTFKLNVTAPPKEQEITLHVSVTARAGTVLENTTAEKTITVITPVTLSATFRNDAVTAAANVTVRFYVDGVLVGTKTIPRIDATGQASATFNYLPAGLQPGAHSVRVEADLDGNGIIDPSRGEAVVSDLFYKSTTPLSTGWTVLIGIAVFLPVFLVTLALRRRERT